MMEQHAGARRSSTGPKPTRLINAYTLDAVAGWSRTKRQAWSRRHANPNQALHLLVPPGQRLATGPFTEEEEALFEQRLRQFRQQAWPLASWGIFSLALPHRVGSQCQSFYRSSPFYRPGEETPDAPAEGTHACLLQHSTQLQALWTTPRAVQISQQVEQWLQQHPPSVTRRSHRHSTTPASARALPSTTPTPIATTVPALRTLEVSGSGDDTVPKCLAGGDTEEGSAAVAVSSRQLFGQQGAAGSLAAFGVNGPGGGTGRLGLSAGRFACFAMGQQPQTSALQPLRQRQQRQPPSPQHQQQPVQKPSAASTLPQQPPAAVQKPPRGKSASKPERSAAPALVKRNRSARSDGSDDDDFMPGSLKQLPPSRPAPDPTAAARAARPAAKRNSAAAKRRKAGRGAGAVASGVDELTDHTCAGQELTVLRLHPDRHPPGWCRHVAPFTPSSVQLEAATAPDRCIITTPDILSFDLGSLGGDFLGVIINALLAPPLPPSASNGASPADPSGGSAAAGITPAQLATLQLPACLARNALVCVWASKDDVAAAVRVMASAWQCRLVENLTWVKLDAGGQIAAVDSRYACASHATLLMGRRGVGALELRHQRTADVLVSPALGGGRFPDAVRAMMQTLLPHAGQEGAAAAGPAQPRLLEIAFQGAEPGGRAGWTTLVQAVSV